MRAIRISFLLIIFSLLGASCSDEVPDYRKAWQDAHHLDDEQMMSLYGEPDPGMDHVFGLVLEGFDGNWERLEQMTAGSRISEISAYYHNLAMAMKGCLADSLMYYYQPFERGLFLPVDEKSTIMKIAASSEVWFRLGEMTMAEHGAMLAQIFSPNHFGVPYLKRLAEINLVNGQNEVAKKYLRLLSREEGLEDWVSDRIPGRESKAVREYLEHLRSLAPKSDIVHVSTAYRQTLKNLLASDPENKLARQYLLCLDLLVKDLDSFIADYDPYRDDSRLYDEAVLIWLTRHGALTSDNAARFGLSQEVIRDFSDYNNMSTYHQGAMAPMQEKFGKTYWFFYQYAKKNVK